MVSATVPCSWLQGHEDAVAPASSLLVSGLRVLDSGCLAWGKILYRFVAE